ncbi:Arm DNA-binding domain-containing protein [Propionivibrio sp.]|uniref:Arm DNA-binding domain-containing protein n=1 Tax=Propionivibrio sp. TaxID=2212460 RepID=UPI003BF11373
MGSVRVRPESDTLYFDFRYLGNRCRELTTLPTTKGNTLRMQATMHKIEKEIQAGTFSYRSYFPNSKRADLFESPVLITPPTQEEIVAGAVAASRAMTNIGQPISVVIGGTPLFSAFSDLWFTEREIDWKRSTRQKVTDILIKHLDPRFKGRRVGDISKADILAFRTHLAKDFCEGQGLSPARTNGILNILRQILVEAADRFDFTMPYRGIKPLRVSKTDIDPFSLTEVKLILAYLPDAYRPYFTTAFLTALRTSELLGLTWDRVDFERSQILVEEVWVCGELDTPKTPGSQRTIELSAPVVAALRQQQAMTASIESKFVFCASSGLPLSRHNIANRIWHPTLKGLGLKARRPYQTRHTAATLWLASGEAPEWICRQMGHTSTKMLFTVYSRYVPNLTRRDGSAMEHLLASQGFLAQITRADRENEEMAHGN